MIDSLIVYKSKILNSDVSKKPPKAPLSEIMKSTLGSFLGIITITAIDRFWLGVKFKDVVLLYGSFGASAVLLFNAYKSPLSQPWNAFFGQALSAFIGVSVRLFCTHAVTIPPYIQSALAVSIAIAAMDVCDCLHPPGGATALTAIIGGYEIHAMGYKYVLFVGMHDLIFVLYGSDCAYILSYEYSQRSVHHDMCGDTHE